MNLLKKNIHIDCEEKNGLSQISLEEDINLSDNKPDVQKIIYEKGQIQIEEVNPTKDYVLVKGKLLFCMLYTSADAGKGICCYEGKLPFEEKLYAEGVQSTDRVRAKGELEHLNVGTINSRKLSVQALLCLHVWVDEMHDVALPIEAEERESTDGVSYQIQKQNLKVATLVAQKNDILRVREEVQLPASYPNVFDILWKSITLEDVEIRPMEDKLSVQGDVCLFVLYEGEDEEHSIRTFESKVPFSGTMECEGLMERMIPEIRYEMGQQELDVRPDFDGEQRTFGIDMILDFSMKIYAEESVEMISDAYGVGCNLILEQKEMKLHKLLMRMTAKNKLSGRMKIKEDAGAVLQIMHCEGKETVDYQEITGEGLVLQGSVDVQVLYISGKDEAPYNCVRQNLPFRYVLDVPGLKEKDSYTLHTSLEQLQAMAIGGGELDIKGLLCFTVTAFEGMDVKVISDVWEEKPSVKELESRPSMVLCIAGKEDTLWSIGKRYGVLMSQITEVNQVDGEITPGEKLLIVR